MQVTYCDVCKELIKISDTKFLLGLQQVTETDDIPDRDIRKQAMQDYLIKWENDQRKGVLVFEICTECKRILYHLFNMKKEERAKILKSLENSFNKEPKKKKGWGKK